MNTYVTLILTTFLLLFSACSTKEVYKPKQLSDDWERQSSMDEALVDVGSNVALLEDRSVLLKDAAISVKVQENNRLISQSDEWIISASIDGNMTLTSIKDSNITKNFELKKTIATAGIEDGVLAVLFADNEMALYDLESQSPIFKEKSGNASVVDSRIMTPIFMKGLVLFPTLDGKVVIVSMEQKKRLRTVIVSSEDNFNNVIFAALFKNKIIAATPYTILSMSQKEIRAKYELRNVATGEDTLYATTKQGELIAFSDDLQLLRKIKFPFAHFLGMIYSEKKLYILEQEGYMIVVDADSFEYTVHEVDINDGFIFVADKLFYIGDERISIE